MSSSWGINRTMAQIHALLFVVGTPMSVDDIIARLDISRGNASMNLRELMDWGILRRFRKPGERRDTYACDTDVWQMLTKVVRARKRREIDPTQVAIEECVEMLEGAGKSDEVERLRGRFKDLLDMFQVLDIAFSQVFRNDRTLASTVDQVRQG